jgi:hypothetical protein
MDLRREGLILGFAEDHVLVWVEEEMTPDTRSSRILSGTFSPGAYLMQGERALSLAKLSEKVPISLSAAGDNFNVPFFPWRECTNVSPPAEATRSLQVDVKMETSSMGPST